MGSTRPSYHVEVITLREGYGMYDQRIEVRLPAGQKFVSTLLGQTGLETSPISYPMATRGSFPGVKETEARS
jgi:hypothetical protein